MKSPSIDCCSLLNTASQLHVGVHCNGFASGRRVETLIEQRFLAMVFVPFVAFNLRFLFGRDMDVIFRHFPHKIRLHSPRTARFDSLPD